VNLKEEAMVSTVVGSGAMMVVDIVHVAGNRDWVLRLAFCVACDVIIEKKKMAPSRVEAKC